MRGLEGGSWRARQHARVLTASAITQALSSTLSFTLAAAGGLKTPLPCPACARGWAAGACQQTGSPRLSCCPSGPCGRGPRRPLLPRARRLLCSKPPALRTPRNAASKRLGAAARLCGPAHVWAAQAAASELPGSLGGRGVARRSTATLGRLCDSPRARVRLAVTLATAACPLFDKRTRVPACSTLWLLWEAAMTCSD